jgi:hypothetical protein
MRDVQSGVQPDRTIVLPNLGMQPMPRMEAGKMIDGPLYRQTMPLQNVMPDAPANEQQSAPQPIAPQTPVAEPPVTH